MRKARALSVGERYETTPPAARDALGVFPQANGELIIHAIYMGAEPFVAKDENGNLRISAAHYPLQLREYVPEYEI